MSVRRKYATIVQHEPLTVPTNWSEEERRFARQLEERLDDIYRRFGRLKLKDFEPGLRQELEELIGGNDENTVP